MEAKTRRQEDIHIRIDVSITDGWGGERWDVDAVADELTGQGLGDIGIYEFDAHSDFMTDLTHAVYAKLLECNTFKPGVFYSPLVTVWDGGSQLGKSSRHFRGL